MAYKEKTLALFLQAHNQSVSANQSVSVVTAKILMLLLNQKLNNYRGSDVRGDRQFELSLQND